MFRKILFSIDILNRQYCSGWCFRRIFRKSPVKLSFFQDERCLGEAVSSMERQDLLEQNLHPTGRCGFECQFSDDLESVNDRPITIYANNGSRPIATIAMDQVLDVFRPKNPGLFFMHIPKTAGTSFHNYLKQYFGYGKIETHIEKYTLAKQQRLINQRDCLTGHIPLEHIANIYNGLKHVDLHSMVRNPIKQICSHLDWIRGIAIQPQSEFFGQHHPLIQKMGMALNQVDLTCADNLGQIVNNLDGFQIDFFDNIQTRYFLDYRPDCVGPKDLENAIGNLKLFRTIGVTEKYDDYLKMFCESYDLKYTQIPGAHNPSKVKKSFDSSSPELITALDPLIKFDQQLYDHILARNA